jgi:hypothetical protein
MTGLNQLITQRLACRRRRDPADLDKDRRQAPPACEASRSQRDGAVVAGDIILAVNGQPTESVARLQSRLDDYDVGGHRDADLCCARSSTSMSRCACKPALSSPCLKEKTLEHPP